MFDALLSAYSWKQPIRSFAKGNLGYPQNANMARIGPYQPACIELTFGRTSSLAVLVRVPTIFELKFDPILEHYNYVIFSSILSR